MDKVKDFFKKVWTGIVGWFKRWDKAKTALSVGLALVLVGGFLAAAIQTAGFKVQVYAKTIKTGEFYTYTETGEEMWNTADIYRPKSASAENPAPLVLVAPGIQRTKETQASFCIELVRRGFGVICLDPYSQGESSTTYTKQSATNEGYGLFHWMDYLHTEKGMEEFDWVDYTRIGATGHSAGGNGVQKLAEREGVLAKDKGGESRLKAAYITGYIREWNWTTANCNIGISYSAKDEGAFQNETAKKKAEIQKKKDAGGTLTETEEWWLTVGNADMRYAPESIEIVNYQLAKAGESLVEEVEIGVGYGSPYDATYAIINNENCLHALQPYDGETLTNMVGFFGYVFENYDENDLQNGLSDTQHAWLWKELGCGMALAGGFTFMLALFVLLLRTPLFKSLKKEIPQRTGNQKIKGRIIFWVAFVASAAIACVLYVKCAVTSVSWFPEAATSTQTWFFPQRFTNAVMLWAVANGLIGVAIFFLTWGLEYLIDYFAAKKKSANATESVAEVETTENATETPSFVMKETGVQSLVAGVHKSYKSKLDPLKMNLSDLWKTLLMAAILILSFFTLDLLLYAIFHVDMRFLFLSARVSAGTPFNWRAILAMLMYVPFFFIFYMSNSLRVNCSMRPSNWPEWLSQIIAVLGNTVGLVLILFMQYGPFISTGTIGYTGTVGPEWLFVNMLFSIIPMMAALPLFNRFFFNKTGRAWLGAIVICVIFVLMTGSATTIYYAL